MDIDYEDKLTKLEEEKSQVLTDAEKAYGDMAGSMKENIDKQITASQDWATTQKNLQQDRTDLTINQIKQQKEQARKDYTKELSGAYTDYKKESNRYGVGAEEMAAAGLSGTGYSESSQVSMYNAYQSRVAAARESYNQAVLNYDNAIAEAKLQNSSALAEIAYNALQQELTLTMQGLEYENEFLLALEDRKAQIEDSYHNQYMDVWNQMNREREFEESVRQYEQDFAENKRQYDQDYEEGKRRFDEEMRRLRELDEAAKNQEGFLDPEEEEPPKEETSNFTGRYLPGNITPDDEIMSYMEEVFSKKRLQTASAPMDIKFTNGTQPKATPDVKSTTEQSYEVATDYYQGPLNPDAKTFGTFKNGYQPKGIAGPGKLKKTGETIEVTTEKRYGTGAGIKLKVTQNVWKAEDGTLWYWSGRDNEYKPLE